MKAWKSGAKTNNDDDDDDDDDDELKSRNV